ncbi:MAG: serine dehydratase subunit alpha family protein [Atopobiaceae bacterium]|jgi:L-cysteine desulfidase
MLTQKEMLELLHADVVPAIGCTEPACVALAVADAAKTAELAPHEIDTVEVEVSPSIYKNGMSVAIPGYPELGLDKAAAIGAVVARPECGLEIFGELNDERAHEVRAFLAKKRVVVRLADGERGVFVHARVTGSAKTAAKTTEATCTIQGAHTRVVERTRNHTVLELAHSPATAAGSGLEQKLFDMKISDIVQLVRETPAQELAFLMQGVTMNQQASDFGVTHTVGVGISHALTSSQEKVLLGDNLMARITQKVASATEARLGGGVIPCMSSSGAGTKGLAVILPTVELAHEMGSSTEELTRALAIGHLVNRYINLHVGKLAAICTCVMASSTGASAAMAYLLGANAEQIGYAIRNMCGTVTGMICDGGKVGCALKVSIGSLAALNCAYLAAQNVTLSVTDGILATTPEACIDNVGRIANPGMLATDKEILAIMREKSES